MNLTCPKDKNHERFVAKQRILQEVSVDSEGNYISTYNDGENLGSPDYDEATCEYCGAKAVDDE